MLQQFVIVLTSPKNTAIPSFGSQSRHNIIRARVGAYIAKAS